MNHRIASFARQPGIANTSSAVSALSVSVRLLLAGIVTFSVTGCASGLLNVSDDSFSTRLAELIGNDDKLETEEDNDFDTSTKIETPLLREYISVTGNNMVALRGVGLVTGLDGTGGDPPPSHLRKELLDEMGKMKIPNPSRILSSRTTALVMVTAYLPPMVRKGQRFDIRVALPPNSEATSLKGGTLLETRLSEERAVVGRGNLKGHLYGIGSGAILTALGEDQNGSTAMERRGSIPGGAVSRTERNLQAMIRHERRGLRTSKRVETAISQRLHHYNRARQRVPMAEAKTDQMVELMVHPTYRNNFPRYQQMIRSIAYRETDIARRMRMEKLATEILEPETAAHAALQLEAIGRDGIPFLEAGLKSSSREAAFHAAQALAYLEESTGVEALKRAALEEPAFRVYALAALSVINDADSVVALRDLIAKGDLETRYGAVRALKENNPNDQVLGTVNFPGQFVLHAVESSSKPAVHVVRYRSPEVVVFGRQQKFRLPLVLNVGNRIRVIARGGDSKVTITKYNLNAGEEKRETSASIVEILHAVAELGAKYPDIVQMMLEADKQGSLMGELGIDRLPQAGRTFRRASGTGERDARIGTPSLIPGLFERVEESDRNQDEEDESALSRMFSMRSDEHREQETVRIEEPEPDRGSDSSSGEDIAEETIQALDLSEQADMSEESEEDYEIEQTEFKEPFSSRIRRFLTSPFSD